MNRLRKCQLIRNGDVNATAFFHEFYLRDDRDLWAVVELENGRVVHWFWDIKFLEPQFQRVRVHSKLYGTKMGEFHGWTTINNSLCGIVVFDNGACSAVQSQTIQFEQKEVENEN